MNYKVDWSKTSTSAGYIVVRVHGHPRAWSTGYMLAHRVVVEQSLGRLLDEHEVVHHRDGDKHNNSIENLELMLDRDHNREHAIEGALARNGHLGRRLVQRLCEHCGVAFDSDRTWLEQRFCSNTCSARGQPRGPGKTKLSWEHGTYGMYRSGKCRCEACKAANTVRVREGRKKKLERR